MATVRQLEYFLAVLDAGSFTAAAATMNVTQPGLSHQLRALERDLGGAVVTRTPRGIALTPLGRAVLPHARAASADARRVKEAANQVLGLVGGSLDVATINSLSLGVLPALVASWHAAHPRVAIRLREYSQVFDLLDALTAGQADLAVTPLPDSWDGPRHLVGTEEFVVVLPPGHRLIGSDRIVLADLADDAWVHFAEDHGLAGVLDHHARLQGFTPLIALRTEQTAAAVRYAGAGVGPALVPANIVDADCAHLTVRLRPSIQRSVFVVARDDDEPLTAAFGALVQQRAVLVPPADRRVSRRAARRSG